MKKSTDYTFIKKLSKGNFVKNDNDTITALVSYNEIKTYKSKNRLKYLFNKLFPVFLNIFLENKQLLNGQTKTIKNINKIEKNKKNKTNYKQLKM